MQFNNISKNRVKHYGSSVFYILLSLSLNLSRSRVRPTGGEATTSPLPHPSSHALSFYFYYTPCPVGRLLSLSLVLYICSLINLKSHEFSDLAVWELIGFFDLGELGELSGFDLGDLGRGGVVVGLAPIEYLQASPHRWGCSGNISLIRW